MTSHVLCSQTFLTDTDGLWKFHCDQDFKNTKPEEFESWREHYLVGCVFL